MTWTDLGGSPRVYRQNSGTTDTNLDGLNGLTGVTRTGSADHYTYTINGVIRVEGTLSMGLDRWEQLNFESSIPFGQPCIQMNGGTFTMGRQDNVGGRIGYPMTAKIVDLRRPDNSGATNERGFSTDTTGLFADNSNDSELIFNGVIIHTMGSSSICGKANGGTITSYTSTCTIRRCLWVYETGETDSGIQLRFDTVAGSDINVAGLELTTADVGQANAVLVTFEATVDSFSANLTNATLQAGIGTQPQIDFADLQQSGNLADVDFLMTQSNTNPETVWRSIDSDVGTSARLGTIGNTSRFYTVAGFEGNLDVTLLDSSNAAITSDAIIYMAESDNSDRFSLRGAGATQPTPAITSIESYFLTPNGSGIVSQRLRTGWKRFTVGGGGTPAETVYAANSSDDEYDIFFGGYGFLLNSRRDVVGRTVGGVSFEWNQITDPSISAARAIVDLYTTLETFDKAYDRLVSEKIKTESAFTFPNASTFYATAVGTTADTGLIDTVIDKTAPGAYALNQTGNGTLTLKADDFGAGTTFTAWESPNIDFVNGAEIADGANLIGEVTIDSAQDLANVTITGDLRISTGADSTLAFTNVSVSGNVFNDSASNTLTINAAGGTSITTTEPGTGNGQVSIVNAATVTLGGTGFESGVNWQARDNSDDSLIDEGTSSGTTDTVSIDISGGPVTVNFYAAKYGKKRAVVLAATISADTNINFLLLDESFIVANEATAMAYTGVTEDYSARTITIGSGTANDQQEIFDRLNYTNTLFSNIRFDPLVSTVNGIDMQWDGDLTISTGITLTGDGLIDLGSNDLTLSGTGTYDDTVRIKHSGGTNMTIAISALANGRLYRNEQQSDNALIEDYEGTATGSSLSIKHLHTADIAATLITGQYGFRNASSNYTITDNNVSVSAPNATEPFVVADEATAMGYTGIALDFSSRTSTHTAARTVQEFFDYHNYQQSRLTNLTHTPLLSSVDGVAINVDADITVNSGGAINNSSPVQTIALGASDLNVNSGGSVVAPISVGTNGVVTSVSPALTVTMTGTAQWNISGPGTATGGSAVGTATITVTASTTDDVYNFKAFTFDASTTFENTSSNNIILQLDPSDQAPTESENPGTIDVQKIAPVTAANLLMDSHVRLFNLTDDSEIELVTLLSDGYSRDLLVPSEAEVGDTLCLEVALYRTDGTIRRPLNLVGTLNESGLSFTQTQTTWADLEEVHDKGVTFEGPNVTGFTLDVPNIEIDTNITEISGWKLATWLYYQIATTGDGIRNYFQSFEELNISNWIIRTAKVDLKIDNTGMPATWVDAAWTRDDGGSIVAESSETIQFNNNLISIPLLSGDKDALIDAIHQIMGLDSGNALTVTPTSRSAGTISQTISKVGDDVTVTRTA